MEMSYLILHLLEILQIMSATLGSDLLVLVEELARYLDYGMEQFLNVNVSVMYTVHIDSILNYRN